MYNKPIKLFLFIFSLVLVSVSSLKSQTIDIEQFFKKYTSDDGVTFVNFSPGPGAMESAANAKNVDKEVTEMMKDIKTVKILSTKKGKAKINLFDEAVKSVNLKDWEQYLEVKEDSKNVKMLYKKGTGNKVKEFLLLVSEEGESNVIWITGMIDLNDIPKIQNMMGKGKKSNK